MTRLKSGKSRVQINARLIREKDRVRARELRRLLLCGAIIVAPLLGYVWQRVEFLRLSYRVEALQKEKQELQEVNKQMTVERSLLLSPDRIERVARVRLGLVDPPPADVRRVRMIDGRIDMVPDPVADTSPVLRQDRELASAVGLIHAPAPVGGRR